MAEVARLHASIIKTKNLVLRCPRPRPRGLAAPRSTALASLGPAHRPNPLRPAQLIF